MRGAGGDEAQGRGRQAEGGRDGGREAGFFFFFFLRKSVPADTAPGFSSLPLISATGFIVCLQ